MLLLGEKYKFVPLELKKIKKKFTPYYITYKNKSTIETIAKIEKILSVKQATFIVLNTKAKVPAKLVKYLTSLELRGIKFMTIEYFLESYLNKIYIPDNSSDISFLDTIKPFNKWQYFQKRVIDFSIAIPLAVLTSPIMLYAAYRIKKESPEGEIIFSQKRVGEHANEFVCLKFRSMIPDAEKGKPQFACKDDPRIFKWGAFMRKTRIDELPQLINVFKGEMHMIGPRPERKYWVEQFEKEIPYYSQRHLIAPGITGWAQVMYPYGENAEDAKQKLMYDLYYIKNWSLALEIKTIFKTAMVMLMGKGL